MSSIIKVNTFQDANGNALFSSDGSGNVTTSASGMQNTPAFDVELVGSQTFTNNVSTKVQFNTEVLDTDNCYDSTTNYRFTPTVAGKYFIYLVIGVNGNADSNLNNMYAQLKKNGSQIALSHNNYNANSNRFGTCNVNAVIDFNGSTDYVEAFVQGFDNSGSPQVEEEPYSRFGGYKLIGA